MSKLKSKISKHIGILCKIQRFFDTNTNTNIFIETKDHIITKLIYKQTLCTTTKLIHVDKHKQLR